MASATLDDGRDHNRTVASGICHVPFPALIPFPEQSAAKVARLEAPFNRTRLKHKVFLSIK